MDRRGRREFFAQQYTLYLPRVLNYVRLRVDDEALAQDLTAQAFERALSRLDTLRDEEAFGGWLFRIARNVVAGHYRHRRGLVSLDRVADQPSQDPPVEREIEQAQALVALRDVLSTLSERGQEIIRLRFVAGLTNRAIGKAIGLRAGNVGVILYRALRKLKAKLQDA